MCTVQRLIALPLIGPEAGIKGGAIRVGGRKDV